MFKAIIIICLCTLSVSLRVAIIGGGIGGSTTAHFLMKEGIQVEMFEKDQNTGGRVKTKDGFEYGAQFLISENKILVDLVAEYGLSLVDPKSLKANNHIAFTDGEETKMTLKNDYFDIFRLVYNYGLSIFRTKSAVEAKLEEFSHLYSFLDQGKYWESVQEFTDFVKLSELLQKDAEAFFKEQGVSSQFYREVIGGALSSFYNQGSDVHASVGFITAAGLFREAFNIKGGNQNLIVKMKNTLVEKGMVVHNKKVTKISESKEGVEVHFEGGKVIFDRVVIAAHLNGSEIEVENKQKLTGFTDGLNKVVVTMLKGVLKERIRGIDYSNVPDDILLNNNYKGDKVSQISKRYREGVPYYYVQSKEALTKADLEEYFDEVEVEHSEIWNQTFPNFKIQQNTAKLASFKVSDRIIFNNGLEVIGSAMEVACISGKNAANMIINKIKEEPKNEL